MAALAFLVAPAAPAADAPASAKWRIGILMGHPHDEDQEEDWIKPFKAAMNRYAAAEKKPVEYLYESANVTGGRASAAALSEAARRIVAAKPDVIWVGPSSVARAAMGATQTIPIVGTAMSVRILTGDGKLVSNQESPERNLTGVVNVGPNVGGKRFEYLYDVMHQNAKKKKPKQKFSHVGVLITDARNLREYLEIKAAADRRGVEVVRALVEPGGDAKDAFDQLVRARVQAVLVTHVTMSPERARQLVRLANDRELPLMGARPAIVRAGALASYNTSLTAQIEQAARIVHKLLTGSRVEDIPIEKARTRTELVYNEETARALGLSLPEVWREVGRRVPAAAGGRGDELRR
ncbi:MAG TPA: ABC transporter substrate-binding protein [Burkholderiales bacterium]|nr:ABC transporter substrate-binding protein [Burkholderiales bacterium]